MPTAGNEGASHRAARVSAGVRFGERSRSSVGAEGKSVSGADPMNVAVVLAPPPGVGQDRCTAAAGPPDRL